MHTLMVVYWRINDKKNSVKQQINKKLTRTLNNGRGTTKNKSVSNMNDDNRLLKNNTISLSMWNNWNYLLRIFCYEAL